MKLDLKINFRFNLAGLRKYTMLLIPLGIVLGAGILFGLVILSGRSLVAQIQKGSLSVSNRLDSMIQQTPSSRQWEQAKQAMDQMAEEIGKVEQLAKQDSQRVLLSYKIFPQPKETSHQIYSEFGDQFRRNLEDIIVGLKAMDAPTEAELTKEAGVDTIRGSRGIQSVTAADQSAQRIIDAFCVKRAQELCVYINPKQFSWYGFWEKYKFEGEEQAIRDCWNSQIAFWIYEDIFSTISRLNEGSPSVLTSPVKRLAGIRFFGPVDLKKDISGGYGGGYDPGMMEAFRDEPRYVQSISPLESSSMGRDYAFFDTLASQQSAPWTNRMCNAEVDVLHFFVGVVIDARSVYAFMQELCSEKTHPFRMGFAANGKEVDYKHNSITIMGSQIEPVERADAVHASYRYGSGAVVFLRMECEYLFHRAGYEMIQPDSIKKMLGISVTPPGGGAATPASAPAPAPMDRRR